MDDSERDRLLGSMESNMKNFGENLTQLGKDVRTYSKYNRDAHRVFHSEHDKAKTALVGSETRLNDALTKVTDTFRTKHETTDKSILKLQNNNVWLGRIWAGVCVVLVPVVIYIIKETLKHIDGG